MLLVWLLRERNDQPGDAARLRNDPTYSPRNYKQPNKAATARDWEANPATPVPKADGQLLANYKQPQPGAQPGGSLTVTVAGSVDDKVRNYKVQHSVRPTRPPADAAGNGLGQPPASGKQQ